MDPEVYGRLWWPRCWTSSPGKHEALVADLTEQMNRAAGELDFEKAAEMRDAIEDVRRIAEGRRRSPPAWRIRISSPWPGGGRGAGHGVLRARRQDARGREQYTLDVQGDESMGEIAESFLAQYYAMMRRSPRF